MKRACLLAGTAMAFSCAISSAAWAADDQESARTSEAAGRGDVGDIIVTARRRDETSLSVPVILSAVSGKQLEASGTKELEGIARVVPQLLITRTPSVQGGNVTLRGMSSTENNPFADQAVSFNIDGVPVARASIARLGQLDLEQIEVLKGPQALFFGKNSPGGIIVMRSADPTPTLQAKLSAGYEFVGDEARVEEFVSGPLTDTLGARLAFFGSRLSGYITNDAPTTGLVAPARRKLPFNRELAGRITLKFEPGDTFDARLKVAYNRYRAAGPSEGLQLVDCPDGTPFYGGADDCVANNHLVKGDGGAIIGAYAPGFNGGVPFSKQDQVLASYEMNYRPGEAITISSISALFYNNTRYSHNASSTATANGLLVSASQFRSTELSQEVRVSSDYDGPVNFMAGVYYQHSKLYNPSLALANATAPFIASNGTSYQKGEAYSVFLQARWLPVETVEVSGGGRYSRETKDYHATTYFGVPIATPVTHRSFPDFSPEASITWRPTQQLTVFGSYKRGFLSGGFNAGAGSFAVDRSYGQQTIKGFEGGVKALLFDGAVRANLSAYRYTGHGLQVSTTLTNTAGVVTQSVVNAGSNTTKGVEFDVAWKTPADGLRLRGALSYNRSVYGDFQGPCYRGQTIALGCAILPLNGVFTAQDLGGRVLARAPRLGGNAGFDYDVPLSAALKFGISGDTSYTSGYFTDASNKPASWQRRYWLFNVSARVAEAQDRWEIALIGRNLSNRYYLVSSSDVPLTGSGVNGTAGPTTLADTQAIPSRGREVMLRLTARLGN